MGALTPITDMLDPLVMRGVHRRWPPKPKQAAWLRSLVAIMGGWFDG